MTVIPFPRKSEEKVPDVVKPSSPSLEEIAKVRAAAMMRAALQEAARMGVAFVPGDINVRDSLLAMEAMLSFLMRLDGLPHVFQPLAEDSFRRMEDGSYQFLAPHYENRSNDPPGS